MKYTKENPKFIESENDIVGYNLKTRDYVEFICKKCGKQTIKQIGKYDLNNLDKFKICTSCIKSVFHYTKDNPKEIQTLEDFKGIKEYDSFKFICKQCGKETIIESFRRRRFNNYKSLLCPSCKRSNFRKDHPELIQRSLQTSLKYNGGKYPFDI